MDRLPTDNLYKFMALSGVAAAIAGVFFALQEHRDHRRLEMEHQIAFRNHAHNVLKMKADTLEVAESVEKFWGRVFPAEPEINPEEDQEGLRARALELYGAVKALENAGEEVWRAQVRDEEEHKFVETMVRTATLIEVACVLGAVLGLSVSAWGFRLWYVRLQLPLDEELLELRKSRSALELTNGHDQNEGPAA